MGCNFFSLSLRGDGGYMRQLQNNMDVRFVSEGGFLEIQAL